MSREEAIDLLDNLIGMIEDNHDSDYDKAFRMAIKALDQEPCEDCISRADVETFLDKYNFVSYDYTVEDLVKALPSVTPKREIGHWIQINEFFINPDGQFIYKFICSECKSLSYFRKSNKKAIGANVCPNCGCKMSEIPTSSESEGKE